MVSEASNDSQNNELENVNQTDINLFGSNSNEEINTNDIFSVK